MKKLNMDEWRAVFQQQMEKVKPNDVWSLKMDRQLGNLEPGWKQVLQEHAHASFRCSLCDHRWSSHQVVIQFVMHWERFQHQGWVWMKVFRQQCDKCTSEKYEEPQFTKTDVDNVIKHLILDIREKCYRERVDHLSEVIWEHTGPHKHQHCEACKLGIHKWHHRRSQDTEHHEHGKDRIPTFAGMDLLKLGDEHLAAVAQLVGKRMEARVLQVLGKPLDLIPSATKPGPLSLNLVSGLGHFARTCPSRLKILLRA
ncbi:receptor-transporting protein 2-like [Eublepharis macularius]|uniref:Receptor-transporting protein 2-like n=1 Tax=Eublepharis macularius TaxID=481883 RepID=A0AA97L1E2_EUBMA|nr:receptor-transporting protein 2-like [Eublepharis macularius]